MLKIATLMGFLRMKATESLPCLVASLATALLSGQAALGYSDFGLHLPVPPRIVDLLSGAQGGVAGQAHVDADFPIGRWVHPTGYVIARDSNVPGPGLALHGAGFGLSLKGAMELDADFSNFTKPNSIGSFDAESGVLRPSQTIVTIFGFESWVSRRLTEFNSTKETLKVEVYTVEHIVENLRMDLCDVGSRFSNYPKLRLLFGVVNRHAFLPGFPTFLDGSIVQLTTEFKPRFKSLYLSLGGIDPVLEGSPESRYNRVSHMRLIHAVVRGRGPFKREAASITYTPCSSENQDR